MQIMQLYTKIVPYYHPHFNDEEFVAHAERELISKYWFMNL